MCRTDWRVWSALLAAMICFSHPASAADACDSPKDPQAAIVDRSGELSLTEGLKEEATRLFRLVASDCPNVFTEWDAATAELKALGVAP